MRKQIDGNTKYETVRQIEGGFPAYIVTPPCYNGISCANKGWNPPFAGLHLNGLALSEIFCRILYFISYNL